jgi:hypothetical protein
MGYQSKTYSLSDEVIEAIEAAKTGGLTPNQFLRRLIGIDAPEENGDSSAPDSQKALNKWRANRKPIPKHKDRAKG